MIAALERYFDQITARSSMQSWASKMVNPSASSGKKRMLDRIDPNGTIIRVKPTMTKHKATSEEPEVTPRPYNQVHAVPHEAPRRLVPQGRLRQSPLNQHADASRCRDEVSRTQQ